MSFGNIEESLDQLHGSVTPFLAQKTAEQTIDFDIDPSKGLTKKRYKWYSDNTLHDDTYFSDIPGAIEISTSGSGSDTARIQSGKAGQYRSQTLSVPGVGFTFNSGGASTSIDGDGLASLNDGLVAIGAGWHAGTNGGWNVSTDDVITFLGFKADSSGVEAVLVSDGSHLENSPVSQEDWNIDTLDGSGANRSNPSGLQLDLSKGYIWNGPYTWYNQGALIIGFVDKTVDKFIPVHRFEVENQPSLDRPNMPTHMIVDENGDAASITIDLGGMQYSRYGAGSQSSTRTTPVTRVTSGNYIGTEKTVLADNSVSPRDEPGVPLVSVQSEQAVDDTVLKAVQAQANVNNDIYLYFWDEFDPDTALTGETFRDPTANLDEESKIVVDTEATDFTPADAVFRGYTRIEGGNKDLRFGTEQSDDVIPIGATRIVTAVHDGSSADATPIKVDVEEGF